jgi:D-hydroxyproline dehydrogenase subunit gamma
MTIASRFQPRPEGALRLTLDGATLRAHRGDSLAAALLTHSGDASRETGRNTPRTAFCMMGVCFDCLVEVDGQSNVQACITEVRDGMTVRRQIGLRKLGAADV